MTRVHVHCLVLLASAVSVAGCQDLPELTHETEHLQLGADFPLCQGDLDHYEHVVSTLELELGAKVDKKIKVYLWDIREVEDPGWCKTNDLAGCYSQGRVYSAVHAVEHELVHAVVDTFNDPSRFWSEGAAEALQVDRTLFGASAPSVDVDKGSKDDLSYATAGHFSRWLVETHGIELYRDLLRSPDSGREAFEGVYGLEFEDVEANYLETAPHSYGAFIACDDEPLAQVDDQTWSESIDIACSEPSTYGSITGLYSRRVITIAERGQYAVSTSASHASITRCMDGTYDEPPTLDDVEQYGDLPEYTAEWINGYAQVLDGSGEVTTLDLTPGRYRIAVGFESFDARMATLDVGAAEGP